MDIFLFILIGLAILLLVAATSRVGNNSARLNVRTEGWNGSETLRWLRESQEQEQLEKAGRAKLKLEQREPVQLVSELTPPLPRNAD